MSKYKLTIAVLTMNRAEQMRHAIESCLNCVLPSRTQFVIVDNASTDHTQGIADELKKISVYDILYKRLPENRGVGGGRNVCFDLAEGEYIYLLDDDAEISEECYESFFVQSLEYMDRNHNVMTLTTRIEDRVYGKRIPILSKSMKIDGLPCAYLFQGGSTFLRRDYFFSPLFMNIMYGHEEVPVSMAVWDAGKSNVYMTDIFVNHLPKVNKWKIDQDKINVHGISNIYAIKSMLYPSVFRIPLFLVYRMRLRRYHIKDKTLLMEEEKARKAFMAENKIKKIRFISVIRAFREFGVTVF